MSFDMETGQILRYAYNVFASVLPTLYLFIGAAFGAYVLAKIFYVLR